MTDDVKPDVIKKTQDLLGKYFKKPPLTEKLLKKPPFRFLHDIVSAVIKETGFLDGLFTEEELNSDNIRDKETKLAFLTKLVDVVRLISGSNLTVRPSKIISGQEPTKTNELLHAIGKALDKKISSAEAIEHYKRNSEKKGKFSSRSKSSTSKDERRPASKQASQGRKHSEKEKNSTEKKRSSSTSKIVANELETREEGKQVAESPLDKSIDKADKVHESNTIIEIPPAEPLKEKVSSSQKRRQSSSAKSKQSSVSSVPPSESTKTSLSQENSISDKKTDKQVRRRDSARKTKRTLLHENSDFQNELSNTIDVEGKKNNDKKVENTVSIENQKNGTLADNELLSQNTERFESATSEFQKSYSENADPSTSEENLSRSRTSLRPPTVRPISARPAAPRIRAKAGLSVNEEISTPMGNISVIIENADAKDDDDAEDMVVMETRGGGSDSVESGVSYKMDHQLTQEHGHLVAQILETQRELVNNESVDVIPKKTDITWDTGSKRDREIVAKEIDRLRSTIQMLTRATNPLGKLLDYLQEDAEMMQKELLEWRNQYRQLTEQLEKEKTQTQELIEPMKETLKDIDNNMKTQLDKICQAKSQIIKNDQRIQTLLNGHL